MGLRYSQSDVLPKSRQSLLFGFAVKGGWALQFLAIFAVQQARIELPKTSVHTQVNLFQFLNAQT